MIMPQMDANSTYNASIALNTIYLEGVTCEDGLIFSITEGVCDLRRMGGSHRRRRPPILDQFQ